MFLVVVSQFAHTRYSRYPVFCLCMALLSSIWVWKHRPWRSARPFCLLDAPRVLSELLIVPGVLRRLYRDLLRRLPHFLVTRLFGLSPGTLGDLSKTRRKATTLRLLPRAVFMRLMDITSSLHDTVCASLIRSTYFQEERRGFARKRLLGALPRPTRWPTPIDFWRRCAVASPGCGQSFRPE